MTQVQPSSDSGAKVGTGVRKGVNHEWIKLDLDNIQDQGSQSSTSDSRVHSLLLEGLTDPCPETFQGGCNGQSLQRYYYSERERYLPLANITRSLKDVIAHVFPGINVKVSKEGEHFIAKPCLLRCDNFQPNNAFKRSPRISSSQ
jgi:hypothetical protein